MNQPRTFTTQRLYGMGFIVIVLLIIFGIHLTYVFLIFWPQLPQPLAILSLLVHYTIFSMLLTSFYQCVMTDPGLVPPNWGFYMGDETKRRRYCKMCNVWKPDRTHHCSICNRCILNMDHHCPWINNCVGFYNRKFFIQLLLYVYAVLWAIVITSFMDIVFRILSVVRDPYTTTLWSYLVHSVVIMMFCMCVMLIVTLTNFIKFHLKLVLENYTTIENLERDEGAKSKFDIGRRRNLEQVMGASPWLWWLPVHTNASRPIGDGVRWRVHYTRVIDEDEELPAEGDAGRSNR